MCGLVRLGRSDLLHPAATIIRAPRAVSALPFAFRNTALVGVPRPASTGRLPARYVAIARAACCPNSRSRSLDPLPITRSRLRATSRRSIVRVASSLMRMPGGVEELEQRGVAKDERLVAPSEPARRR